MEWYFFMRICNGIIAVWFTFTCNIVYEALRFISEVGIQNQQELNI